MGESPDLNRAEKILETGLPVGQIVMYLAIRSMVLSELEAMASRYSALRSNRSPEAAEMAARIIDHISNNGLQLPLKEQAQSNNGKVTFLYEHGSSFPLLFAFLGEILHTNVPVEAGACKFGPAEIIVTASSESQARKELAKSQSDLRRLVSAKKAEALSKHSR